MQQIVVIGSNGQLGSDLMAAAEKNGTEVVGLTHSAIELADMESIARALAEARPAVVINTAACHGGNQYTAEDQEAFFRVNTLGPWHLARWCRQQDVTLVHYSTDYVFGNETNRGRPYVEDDTPSPVNIYGASKLSGEHLVRAFCPRHYIIRVASLFGHKGCRAKGDSNFVKMVLDKIRKNEPLQVVDDQIMSPTWTWPLAKKTLELVRSKASFGLYHMAGSGACSWYEFACEIIEAAGATLEVRPTATPAEGQDAIFIRPRYTALRNDRLRQAGLDDLPDWRPSLREYIGREEGRQSSI